MTGYILDAGHRLLQALARAFRRPDPRIAALAERTAAKDALRRATVKGDTRLIHEHREALKRATTALLWAEVQFNRRAA